MRFRSAWTGLLLMVVMAVACFGPACGVACAAKSPCHDAAMANCTMGPMASVHAAHSHTVACAQDDAVVDRSGVDVLQVAVVGSVYRTPSESVVSAAVVRAVRGVAKVPPRLAVVMRV